jgi:hypothetical protein
MMMRKKRMRANGAAAEESTAAAQVQHNGYANGEEHGALLNRSAETPAEPAKPHAIPANHRELGRAIFAKADPVRAGCEILEPGEQRADPTRLNGLKTFADWVYGRPDGQGRYTPPRIIWDLPCPSYEPADPEKENAEGGEA